MKAISLLQPWASLVAAGEKGIETRSWQTKYRGPLAIHASAGFSREARERCQSPPFQIALVRHGLDAGNLPLGKVIALGELYDILIMTPEFIKDLEPKERALGSYAPGRFAWKLRRVNMLEEPVAAKGSLGLWEWQGGY